MAKNPNKITERVKTAWIDPEFNRIEKGAKEALEGIKKNPEGQDVAAVLLERAFSDLDAELSDLEKLGIVIPPTERAKFKQVYERRFRVHTADMEREAVLQSPESLNLQSFVDEYVNYTGLDRLIEEARKRQSKDPLYKMVRVAKASTPLLIGLGSSLSKFLAESSKDKEGEGGSRLDDAAKKADEAMESAEDAAKKAGEKAADKAGEAADKAADALASDDESDESGTAGGDYSGDGSSSESYGGSASVESAGTVEYEFVEDNAEKLSPEDFRKKYASIEDRTARNMFVLQQVAAGNATNAFEKLKITGNTGMTVEMEVDQSGLRVAGMDVQLDGPTAMAAAEISGCTLPTPWISEQIWKQAKANDGVIPFIPYDDIAKELGIPRAQAFQKVKDQKTGEMKEVPNGNMMMSPEFALKRDEMLKKYREGHEGKLVAGYFKDIVQPVPGETGDGRLEIYGGKVPVKKGDETEYIHIQDISGGAHEAAYSDYSHQARRVRRTVKVTENGQTKEMDIAEFYASEKYAKEFGFQTQQLKDPAYEYPEAVQKVVDDAKAKQKDAGAEGGKKKESAAADEKDKNKGEEEKDDKKTETPPATKDDNKQDKK